MTRSLIVDESTNVVFPKLQKDPLPIEFGRNLDTSVRARLWLTNPANWFQERIYILKWDGLVPRISAYHGMRLINEPWDNGLAEVVVIEQARLKRGEPKNDDEVFEES